VSFTGVIRGAVSGQNGVTLDFTLAVDDEGF
jgi:hypothetical protein